MRSRRTRRRRVAMSTASVLRLTASVRSISCSSARLTMRVEAVELGTHVVEPGPRDLFVDRL